MKINRAFILALVLFLCTGTFSAQAAASGSSAVSQPWKIQLFTSGLANIKNLSTAFVGDQQIPILSYSLNVAGDHYIYYAHPATPAAPGNCGPNNTWHCAKYWFGNLVPGTLSPINASQKADKHILLQWAFQTAGMLRGTAIELTPDMNYYNLTQGDLLKISNFGGELVGTPTLGLEGGRLQMAATIRDTSDLYGYKLVYMNYAILANNSCLVDPVHYQCAVIDQSNGLNSMGTASLQVAPDGAGGIAYTKYDDLMFAYFHMSSTQVPSNCGLNGDIFTWRCISIFAGTGTSAVGNELQQAVGLTGSNRAIAFTFGNTSFGKYLMHATFVGSGGNCGTDLDYQGNPVDMWSCNLLVLLGNLDRSFSIAIDPQGYSVIAYEYATEDLAPVGLYLGFPKARAGMADPGWMEQRIDFAPTDTVTTGALASLSINSVGAGFIGYLQEEESELPNLKIAWQYFRNYLPLIRR